MNFKTTFTLVSCLTIGTFALTGTQPALSQNMSNGTRPAEAFSPAPLAGRPAPDFTLPDIHNKPRSLSSFRGKYVILEWINFNCPFTAKHYSSGNMQKLQKEYAAKGAVWLSINSSAPGRQGSFTPAEITALLAEKNAAPSYYLLDSTGKVGKLYAAKTTPHMFVINPKGVLIYSGAIDDKPTADASDIAGANNYVKAALDQALAGKPVKVSSTQSYGCSVKY
jgi:peroxiredoxin